LINEHQTLKDNAERTEAELQAKISTMTTQLNDLKTDHYKLVKANEENTAKLKNELSNSLNSDYLKNVLSSYFSTNDTTVQANLIKVVFKVMKYTEEEQQKVMTAWSGNNKSMVQRWWEGGYV